ncbi:MAG: hypothetical protein WCA11_03180 [Terracidiphilus sp.]
MKFKWWFFLVAPPAIVLFGWIFGEVVMHLWNWLMPMLFGLHAITFWQGIGLLILSRILFGGWGGGSHRGNRSERGERWARMTPEEREKFRQNMRKRWCDVGAPPSETGEPA